MKKNRSIILLLLLICIGKQLVAQSYNYADALQKSIFFYECQRSGTLPADNRVNWRGPSGLTDGADAGVDLTGGWYDAGDNVKFNFPMAFSATALAWGAIDFQAGYVKSGQLSKIKESLRWVNDYFIKCHTAPNELYGQVGNGGADHAFWGAAEIMQMARPSYKIDATKPGSDLAAETAASMAAAAIVFKTDDPTYSATLLKHAKELYQFADTYRGKYSSAITDAATYYNSWSGYQDELVWGAIWLYRATNDAAYLTKAESEYLKLSNEGQEAVRSYKWTMNWDDKTYGCYVLLAKLTNKDIYKTDAERHLNYWVNDIKKSPGGLAWLDTWGSLRYASNTAFLAFFYSDFITDATKKTKYFEFAKKQINYTLGDNPGNRSFVCGFGVNPPVNPHHRTAHGGWSNNITGEPVVNRHVIYGALVGGPDASDKYTDSRSDYISNEIACDYNACFTGAVARMAETSTLAPLPIIPEVATDEFYCDSKINATSANFLEPAVMLFNHTAWPARVTKNLSFRYFIDISEGVAAGKSISDYSVNLSYGQGGTISPLTLWSGNIYYCEISFTGALIYPGGQSECRREAQFRIVGPTGAWDISNDPSAEGISGTSTRNDNIAIYDNGVLVAGREPGPLVSYEITASASAGGSISPQGVTLATKGSSKQFTLIPSIGYKVASVKVDGVATLFANNSYTFTNVAANHTIEVAFAAVPTYTITATAPTNGVISPSGDKTYSEGASQLYSISGNSGFKVDDVKVDGVSKGSINSFTFSNISANHTITATFITTPIYTVTATQSANGTISPAGVSSVNEGDDITYSFTPNSGYVVQSVNVNGVSVGAVTQYVVENVTSNSTISATFAKAPDCTLLSFFAVPRATALPSTNLSFSYVFVLGSGGPSMSNITKFDLNWDLANKGLYTFALNTNNGVPSWYISFLSGKLTHNLGEVSPALKIADSGISGLDGDYWITLKGLDLVLVAKSGLYALYFSNTNSAPSVCLSTLLSSDVSISDDVALYPNPITLGGAFAIQFHTALSGSITVLDMNGVVKYFQSFEDQEVVEIATMLKQGVYFVVANTGNELVSKKLIVR